MSTEQYYRIKLDDYSAAAFTSFDKPYFGTMKDLEAWVDAISRNAHFAARQKTLVSNFRAYQEGNHTLTHSVAYQEVRFLDKVQLLHCEQYALENFNWEHLNTWRWPYYMSCDSVKTQHLWLRCKNRFYRCVKARFANLKYGTEVSEQDALDGGFWGFPEMLAIEPPLIWNRLAELEKEFKSLEEATADWEAFKKSPDPDFSEFCNDIFGDG